MELRTVAAQLADAQARAVELFREIEAQQLVRAGQSEAQIDQAIFALAQAKFGVDKHWHRRVVRSGPHTRMLFKELPPDRVVTGDDIVSIDLGPVFDSMEADFGRSYVIGNSEEKHRLQKDLAWLFSSCRDHYLQHPEITGAQFYEYVCNASKARGWTFGGVHAGHLVGAFPFSRGERDLARNRIRPDNEWPMSLPDEKGEPRHWILEIHLLDPTGQFGGFYEELLK